MSEQSTTDFNDLHLLQGSKVVKQQIMAALQGIQPLPLKAEPHGAAQTASQTTEYDTAYFTQEQDREDYHLAPPVSPHPSEQGGPAVNIKIEDLLKRYALAMPDAKVWDRHQKQFIKQSAFRSLVTKAHFDLWLNHPTRRTVQQANVQKAAEQEENQKQLLGPLGEALQRYVYLYPSTDVWDRLKRKVVPANALKLAIASCYEDWSKHPNRIEIDIENLVFDPTESVDLDTHINMFSGLPLIPQYDDSKCTNIRRMLGFLCNDDRDVYIWLINWLAYPLQHVGAKMATAVMMHSEMQGSGKSLFFDGVMRKIYGADYSATLGQHQLESTYTDWRSKMLYGVFEEIFSRDQKYSHTGTVKQMITGETQRIEKKFVSGWEEANHMNAVFLSNEIQPFPVEPFDRRMLIVWPEGKLPEALKNAVLQEIADGGIDAFYGHLLRWDTGHFTTHTEPPMTEAKERLIDFGRPGWDLFYREWERGVLDVGFRSCLLSDLYEIYRKWCGDDHERILSKNKLCQFLVSRPLLKRKSDANYNIGTRVKKGTFIMIGKAPEGVKQGAWLGQCVETFRKEVECVE